jgi:hypothetical protein
MAPMSRLDLEVRLAALRAQLAAVPTGDPEEDGVAGDQVREAYGELLDEHRADPESLSRIREVGRLIDLAVERGDLPRALIRRGPRS